MSGRAGLGTWVLLVLVALSLAAGGFALARVAGLPEQVAGLQDDTAAGSSAISDLSARVDSLRQDLAKAGSSLSDQSGKIDGLRRDLATADSRLSELSSRIADITAGPGSRSATRVVAASNASAAFKAQADYVADGTADDVEINAAIASLPPAGGTVLLSEGTFTLASWIIPDDGLTLRGQGPGKTALRIKDNAPKDPMRIIWYWGAGDYLEDAIFADFSVDGNKANQAPEAVHPLIVVDYSRGLLIDNVETYGAKNACGISLFHADTSTGKRTTVSRSSSHDNDRNGYDLSNGGSAANVGMVLAGNVLENNGWYGLDFHGTHSTISDNLIIGSAYAGISLRPGSDRNTVTGNVLDANGTDSVEGDPNIKLTAASNNVVSGNSVVNSLHHGIYVYQKSDANVVSGNLILNSTWTGIQVYTSSRNTITGNVASRNGNYGIAVTHSGVHNNLSANEVHDNGKTAGLSGIFIDSDYNYVGGNTVRKGEAGNNHAYGVSVNSGIGSIVVANDLRNSGVTSAIRDAGTATIVRNNAGFSTEASGSATVAGGQTAVVVTHGLAGTPATVQLTPTGDTGGVRYWVSDRGPETFTITLSAGLPSDITFDWTALL